MINFLNALMTYHFEEHEQKILRLVRTQDEADAFREGLALISQALYRSEAGMADRIIKERFSPRMGEEVAALVDAASREGGPQAVKESLDAFARTLDEMQSLKIEVAFIPREAAIDALHEWVITHLGNRIILDVDVDRSLQAGVRMMYRGRYLEVSLAQMVSRVIEEERERILQEVNHKT